MVGDRVTLRTWRAPEGPNGHPPAHWNTDIVITVAHRWKVGDVIRKRHKSYVADGVEGFWDYEVVDVFYALGPYYRLRAVSELALMDRANEWNFNPAEPNWMTSVHVADGDRLFEQIA